LSPLSDTWVTDGNSSAQSSYLSLHRGRNRLDF
jgi:hypothetical protein